MPRSRRRIDIDNQARERCKTIIQGSLRKFTGKPQASAIAQRIQDNVVWSKKVEDDKPLLRFLWLEGLKIEVRDALAEWGFLSNDGDRPPQLDLFPPDERDLVRQIDMARIWVPRRGAHVQYHPASGTSAEELDEAADYYDGLSIGIARKATSLRQLAALRRMQIQRVAAA